MTAQVGIVRAMAPVKLRPWSTVWRVEADAGIFYAKQNCPGQNFEAALVLELHEISPTGIVPVVAARHPARLPAHRRPGAGPREA